MESDVTTPRSATRYCCPFPGCNRSFRDFWRLKVHYRAPPGARGSGVERGHGQELPHCPLCLAKLDDVKYHKCSAGPAAQTGAGKKGSSGASQQGVPAASHHAAVQPGMVSNSAVHTLRPTVTWPQHLSVSTTGPTHGYGHGSMGTMSHNRQLVTTMPQAQQQQQQQQQQQMHHSQQAAAVQAQHQQQQQQQQQQQMQLQLPAKQLWVQTGAASGPSHSSAGTTIPAQVTANFQPQQQQPVQQQYPQQQQYHQQQQQQPAWSGQQRLPAAGTDVQYGQPTGNGMQQQQAWHSQQQLQVSAGISAQPFAPAASNMLQQQQQQQQQHHSQQQAESQLQLLPAAPQLLVPAMGQLQQQQQHDPRQLSPVITLPSSHPSNSTVYRPSPRLSGDGGLCSWLLPRLSADGGFGGLGSPWAPAAAAAAVAAAQQSGHPVTPAAAAAVAAASAFRQPGQAGSLPVMHHQQQQPQLQQQQTAWPKDEQQQQQLGGQQLQQAQLGALSHSQHRGAAGKASNNSNTSSSGEWLPGPQGVVQSGALSGLIKGFAAELQARSYMQSAAVQQQDPGAQQQQQHQQGYAHPTTPLAEAWLQQPGAAAAAAAGAEAARYPGPEGVPMHETALTASDATAAAPALVAAMAAAAAPQGEAGGQQGLQSLPECAMRIAEEFKAALSSLRSSMAQRDGSGGLTAAGEGQGPALGRYVSSSGSNSPANSSQGKAPLAGSCESMMQTADQQSPAAAAGVAVDASPGASGADGKAGGSKRPAGDSAAADADNEQQQQQPAKKLKLSPTRSGSAQLPPLGSSVARTGSNGSSPAKPPVAGALGGTPPRAPVPEGAAAGGPFAAASGVGASSQAGAPSRPGSAAGLARSCSVFSDTPPPPEAPAALLELAAQMDREPGGIQLPETADAALECAAAINALTAAWQQEHQQHQQHHHHQQEQQEGWGAAASAAAVAQQLLLVLPATAAGEGEGEGQCGSQKHRALVASLMRKATDDARACGLQDPSPLVTHLMAILDEHVAALSQLGSPGTELAVASAGGVSVELPNAPSVGASPDAAAGAEQCANSAAHAPAACAAAPMTAGAGADAAAAALHS